jgi:beta-lactamase class A
LTICPWVVYNSAHGLGMCLCPILRLSRHRKEQIVKGSKFFAFVLCVLIILYMLYQLNSYIAYRALIPHGTVIAGLPVGGLTEDEAKNVIDQAFGSPVILNYDDQVVKLHPNRVEFRLQETSVWAELDRRQAETSFLQGFGTFLLGEDPPAIVIPVEGRFNEQKIAQFLQDIAKEHDRGVLAPQADLDTLTFSPGQPARWLNVEASIPLVERTLNSASEREVNLVVETGAEPPIPDSSLLEQMIAWRVADFDGIVGVFAKNMATGQEIVINGDVAYAGMSILKVPILIDTYRWLNSEPDVETAKLLHETMITSGNFTANLLLRQIGAHLAGQDSAFAGVGVLNDTLQRLGFKNTFMATPYDTEELPRHFNTPANSRTDLTTYPDPYMQTTPFDTGRILEMIYQLSKGGGTLPAAFPGQFTAQEGQAMIDLMAQNHEAILLEGGLPDNAQLAHKHGYVEDTHADAAIVMTPDVDFVLVVFIYYREGWLGQLSLPIFADIATATYNYFDMDNPYIRTDLITD